MFGRIQHSDHTHTQYISLYLYISLYNSLYTSPYLHVQSFPHIGSLFSSAVHFLPGMFTSKYLKCLMMYSGLLAINYPILSTQNRDFHIHPHIPCFFYLFMVMTGGWFIIVLTTLIWVRPHCDLTGIMVSNRNYPREALFQVSELL